jgi:hypothetical protein
MSPASGARSFFDTHIFGRHQESISSRPRRGTSEVDGMDDYTQQLSGETVAPAGLGRHDATQQTGAQQSYTDALANFFAGVDINDQQQPSGDSFSSMFSGHTKGPEGLDRVENDPKQDFLAGFNPFGSLSSAGKDQVMHDSEGENVIRQ